MDIILLVDTIEWNTGPGLLKLYVFTLKNIYPGLWPDVAWAYQNQHVCGLFARFRKSGLSWSLPAGMSEQELDARLYEWVSTVPVIHPESTVMSEPPVVKKTSPAAQLVNDG